MCKHETKMLVGTANGIVCKACGKTFPDMAALNADRKPKRKKKEAKQ